MTKKKFTKVSDLPTKEDGRVLAPDLEHVNDPAYVEQRKKRAEARRPAGVQ